MSRHWIPWACIGGDNSIATYTINDTVVNDVIINLYSPAYSHDSSKGTDFTVFKSQLSNIDIISVWVKNIIPTEVLTSNFQIDKINVINSTIRRYIPVSCSIQFGFL